MLSLIDSDPGADNAIAILFGLGSADQLDVRVLTAVAGNVCIELTQRNARVVRDWADRTDLPVYTGCARPLSRDLLAAENVHDVSGIDGISIPEPKAACGATPACRNPTRESCGALTLAIRPFFELCNPVVRKKPE